MKIIYEILVRNNNLNESFPLIGRMILQNIDDVMTSFVFTWAHRFPI